MSRWHTRGGGFLRITALSTERERKSKPVTALAYEPECFERITVVANGFCADVGSLSQGCLREWDLNAEQRVNEAANR